jgi:hypothetical protein
MAMKRSARAHFMTLAIATMLATARPGAAQLQISSEDVSVKFGFLGQFRGDWTQDATGSQGYQQNLYMRRGRFMVGGQIGDRISFFFDTDDPNLGKTPKALNAGFLVQDVFVEWKVSREFQISGGEMFAPFSRQQMQSPTSYYSADISALACVSNSATGSSALRDMGFAARGYFFDDRLQYRAGVFQGQREANAHNALRTSGYVQYDFFDREKGYSYVGTALGKSRILALDAGVDKQSDYRAYSANLASDTPVHGGDEVGVNLQYFHFDGRRKFLNIPDQNNFLGEFTYYLHRAKVQPFGRIEAQSFVEEVARTNNIRRAGGGLHYYIRGQNLKWTAQYLRATPGSGSALRPANELTVQLQFFYF